MEYMKFKAVADIQIAKTENKHDKRSIEYRMELLKRRFDDYSAAGFDLEKVRKLEGIRFALLVKFNESLYEPKPLQD